jgi:hypothetical protein
MKLSTLAAGLVIIATPACAAAADMLNADEVKALFAGRTGYAIHLVKDLEIVSYFDADGTTRQTRNGEKWTGKWRVDNDGKHCIRMADPYSGRDKPWKCAFIEKDGGVYYRHFVKPNGDTKTVVKYTKFENGNPDGL